MARPDSLLTRWRRVIAKRVMPRPDPGEAWCIGCALAGGKTVIVSASGYGIHVADHRELISGGGDHTVEIVCTWPPD